MIILKSKEQIEIMDEANKIVHYALNSLSHHLKDGIETKELNMMAEEIVQDFNAEPAFKGYKGFPASLCVSINEEIVHGIPGEKIIKDGDIVSLDFGVKYKGFYGDAAKTFIVGECSEDIKRLVEDTKSALYNGLSEIKIGNRLYDINGAIERIAKENKYGIVKKFCGHGVGSELHQDPPVFNFVNKNVPNIRLQNGIVLAIEPMFCLGSGEVEILSDGWTAITADKSISAHWELSVALIDNKIRILGCQ